MAVRNELSSLTDSDYVVDMTIGRSSLRSLTWRRLRRNALAFRRRKLAPLASDGHSAASVA